MKNAFKSLSDAFASGLRPEPSITLSEWADKHRFLSKRASAESGRWRTSRTPYLKEIMDCLSPSSPIERVVFMKPAQVGATEAGINWIGYVIHHTPAPMMVVAPTIAMAQRNSKQRVTPLIEESPVLQGLVADQKSRVSNNTILAKDFRGGVLIMTGANASSGLRSMPARFLFLDEVDAYPDDVDMEGDAVALAEARTVTFSRRKIFLTSTPTIRDASRIEREYKKTDRRKFFVPCPYCHKKQPLIFGNLKWDEGEPGTAHYLCEFCRERIDESKKKFMLEHGEWRAEEIIDNKKLAGFFINGLYSPWLSWSDIAAKMLEAKEAQNKGDTSRLKVFVNTVLAETWDDKDKIVAFSDLKKRTEPYPLREPPAGVSVLTAGVDVQGDRLEALIVGWGKNDECWVIDWSTFYGNPALPNVWGELSSYIRTPLVGVDGTEYRITATAVDSGGHHTHEVYRFTSVHKRYRVLAIRGSSTRNSVVISRPSLVDINYKGEQLKRGAQLWSVGTDTIKNLLHSRLRIDSPGAGFVHTSKELLHTDFFEQLLSERPRHTFRKGARITEWIKAKDARNEVLDMFVYAIAAAHNVGVHRMRERDHDLIKKRLSRKTSVVADLLDDGDVPKQKSSSRQPTRHPLRRSRKNFVNSWK